MAIRIFRTFRVAKTSLNAVDQKMATLILIVISIIFLSACIIELIERQNIRYFGTALYFIIVTISTVGYGDLSPETPYGKAVICGMIITFMVLVPLKV
jgi:Ion channel.